ncbi:MAG: 3-dehydroquinate synthase [Pyrinomonadaceae bacterium]|nr:3-dehydroquinate synthase [Pyrinomonadaceae bacterium]
MAIERERVRFRAHAANEYHVIVGAGALSLCGTEARRCLNKEARRLALISNKKVFELYGSAVLKDLHAAGFRVEHFLMGDGERYKNLQTLEKALAFLAAAGLERTDGVVALGGGVVGDLAGLAAALHLRGLPLLQIPTTLLAQIDASVGGKTAINTKTGKNVIGVFHQPRAVLIDVETLRTLKSRELTAGWCEAVKHGAAGDRKLFDKTVAFLKSKPSGEAAASDDKLAQLISAHVRFKAAIVSNDEREDVSRTDYRSRRILNFGHTTAHALEAVTNYRRFRHGEAVGYGMLVAGEISKKLGMLDSSELELLREAVTCCGRLPRADDLDPTRIISALASDKKSVGGSIKWVLLERLGRARIVDGREIGVRTLLRASLRAALQRTP